MGMKLDAISVGTPQTKVWKGREIRTSIFKSPLQHPVEVSFTGIAGDRQSDTKLHGGVTRPISVFASEYYSFWKEELGVSELPWGNFGENLNIQGGMFEDELHVGDQFAIGTTLLEVVQPRFPCYKLGMKLGNDQWIKVFLDSRKTGFYFGVLQEGIISPGDAVRPHYKAENSISIADITELYMFDKTNIALLKKAIATPRLTGSWKDYFEKKLEKINNVI
ncbi:MOSC domain-containing protein [Spongiimicrobium salis]|uniref:MOSC domain-containing protein n=1 Tax=Spongiimicrobium salis TaxID=1667022 RepID=UPI00374DEE39